MTFLKDTGSGPLVTQPTKEKTIMTKTTKTHALEASLARSTTDHGRAADIAKAATDAHAKARSVYVADPTEDAGSAVLRTRDAAELANARLAHAQGIRDASQADLDELRATEETARLEAEAEAARVARAAHLAGLRVIASIGAHRERIAAHVVTVVKGERATRAALEGIIASLAEGNLASAELRAAGEDVPDLDSLHILGPVLQARGGVSRDINPIRFAGGNAAEALLSGFSVLDQPGQGTLTPEHAECLREELALRLDFRTRLEADAEVLALHETREASARLARDPGRESPALAPDEDPAPAPSILERARSFFTTAPGEAS